MAVMKIETYVGCRNCSSKVTNAGGIGECSKCSTKMKISKCKSKAVARVLLESVDGKERKVTAFDEVVQKIAGFSEASATNSMIEQLLSSLTLMYTIKGDKIATVSQCTTD